MRPAVRESLQSLGYDVTEGDAVQGYKARGQSLAYHLVIDNSGQLCFTATRAVEPARVVKPVDSTRRYHVTREQQRITTIRYALSEHDDLIEVVREMERIAICE